MKLIRWLVPMVGILFLSACSKELIVTKLNNHDSQLRKGIPYNLQFNKYKVTVTRVIASCIRETDKNGNPIEAIPDVKAFVKAEIESETVDDGDHMYLIDSDSLSGATKISDLDITLEKGRRLVSFNAKSDDQTAEIVASIVSGVGKLAISTISPLPAGARVAPAKVPVVECTEDVATAVGNVVTLEGKIGASSKRITNISEEITVLKLELDSLGDVSSVDCTNSANDQHAKCKLAKAVIALRTEKAALTKTQSQLKSSLSTISYQKIYRWPERSNVAQTDYPFQIPDAQLKEWIKETERTDVNNVDPSQASLTAFKKEFDIYFKLGKTGSYGVEDLSTYAGSENKQKTEPDCKEAPDNKCDHVAVRGIRYRVPAGGYVLVCKKALCDRDSNLAVVQKVEDILQMGHIFYIPFDSGAFANREMAITFDANGALKTAKITQKEAPGENVAGLFKTFADELAAYRKANQEANPPKTELQLLEEQTKLLQAEKALEDAQKQLNPSETTAKLEELRIKTKLAEAQKKYLEAMTVLQPNLELQQSNQALAVLNAETSLIQAEMARLEAIQKLKEIESEL